MTRTRKQRHTAARDRTTAAAALLRRAGLSELRFLDDGVRLQFRPPLTGGKGVFIGANGRWTFPGQKRGEGIAALVALIEAEASQARTIAKARVDVTVIADASFKDGLGGWGAWATCARGSITRSGPLKDRISSSSEAELKALANGLHAAIAAGMVERGAVVMMQSDSVLALGAVLARVTRSGDRPARGGLAVGPLRKHGLKANPAATWIVSLAESYELTIITRHVRGHTAGEDGRHRVNILCDRLAKEGRLEAARRHPQETHA